MRKKGQFIFSKIDLLNGSFGIVPDELDGFYSSSDIPAYSFQETQNSSFLLNWLSMNYATLNIERTGTSETLKRVSKSAFLDLKILAPAKDEQDKIAACLASLDELIAAQTEKVKAFRFLKKGLLQALFPSMGEPMPRLRYPEFENEGEWKAVQLGDLCSMQAGKFIPGSDIQDSFGKDLFPCYGGNGLRGYVMTNTHHGRFPLIGRQGALCGNVTLANGHFYATEHAIVCTHKELIDVNWLFFDLARLNLNRFATGQAQAGLSVDVLKNVPTRLPTSITEQQEIASTLSSLDTLVDSEERGIEALKQHKRALMQQLFPSPEEAD